MEGNKEHMKDMIQNWANIINEGSESIKESKVDFADNIFFHGSKNSGVLKQLKAPSPNNIFFVTNDLDYAWKYTEKNTDEKTRNVYVVQLNQDKLNVFDPWKDSFSSGIGDLWPHEITYALKNGLDRRFDNDPKDLMLIFSDICMYYNTAKKFDFDFNKFITTNRDIADSFYHIEKSPYYTAFECINEMLKMRREVFEPIFEMETNGASSMAENWQKAEELRRVFCRDLKSLGFNAYITQEMLNGARSNKCYGIFGKEAFDSFMTIPIDANKAREALDALEEYEDEDAEYYGRKNYKKSNSIIDIFIYEYKKEMK